MEEFEIILVNDFSTDDTLTYLLNLQKFDKRIKIINNRKNMGTLYSRSIGALSAKGKYIFSLDNDDMFLNSNIFNTIYKIAKKDNWDIVEFTGMLNYHENNVSLGTLKKIFFSNKKPKFPLYQPMLGKYPLNITDNGKLVKYDNYIWNKCIKREIYQKTLKIFGKKRYERFMTLNEDFIVVICLFNIAENFKYVEIYGIINFFRKGSASKLYKDINKSNIYLCDVVVDFYRNKDIAYKFVIYLMNQDKFDKSLEKDDKDKKLFVSILERIYSSQFISENNKNKIKEKANKFNLFK